jgi:two-component system response regulator
LPDGTIEEGDVADLNLIEILLVEDNPNDVALALHAFKKSNLTNRIQVVRDGAEALDYLFRMGEFAGRASGTPKVVLLDLKLPKVDGLEVLQRLRADPRTKSLPVVVLTSSREERDIVESYQFGVNSYIVKPVDFEQFTEVVRQLGFYWALLNQPPIEDTYA